MGDTKTIKAFARRDHGSIAHSASPHGLLLLIIYHIYSQLRDPLQVVFEGVRGRGVSGDIAIDDITFATTRCSVVPSLAVPPTPPPTTPPPVINNCTFEGGFCSWKNLRGDNFDWTRSRGATSSWRTGPTTDHTLGTRAGRLSYKLNFRKCRRIGTFVFKCNREPRLHLNNFGFELRTFSPHSLPILHEIFDSRCCPFLNIHVGLPDVCF